MVSELQILAAAAETKKMASTSNSSTVYSNVKVPLFEGDNYDFWAVKMEIIFTSFDVLEFIQNGYEEPAPTETEESSQRLEELKKKKKITDTGVLGLIQRVVSISIFPRIMRAKYQRKHGIFYNKSLKET